MKLTQSSISFFKKSLTTIALGLVFTSAQLIPISLTSNNRGSNSVLSILNTPSAMATTSKTAPEPTVEILKKNKDGSIVYLVNGTKTKVTKKQQETIDNALKEVSMSSAGTGATTQFLPTAGVGGAVVVFIASKIGVWSTVAIASLTYSCATNPSACWYVAQQLGRGSSWAYGEARRMAGLR
jgi:hypothetical protein